MSEIIPCLLRVGDNVKKYKVIKLDREKVTVGRTGDVNYVILSNMISRCHAVLKRQEDQTWTITDNKSLNGVYVNGKQLQPFIAHSLRDCDMVQFGVPVTSDVPAEFVYKFHSALKIRFEKKGKRFKDQSQESLRSDSSQISEAGSDYDDERERKRKIAKTNTIQDGHAAEEQLRAQEAEYKAKLANMEKLLKEKEEKQSEVEKQLEKERQERERKSQEIAELKEKEQAIRLEMNDRQAQLETEKNELKKKIQSELEITLKEKELALRAQLTLEKESLLEEKRRVEENLQKEMAKALEEKDKEVETQLVKVKDDLEKIIQEKDQEQKMLESRLNETREESEMAKLKALKAKDDVMSDFADLMEIELQCSICNELFIKAVSLNCSHVFCKLCINQWKKVKKECPNCRATITSQMQAIALDSYIDKMMERLCDDLKARRKAIVEHRKAEQDKFDGVKPGTSGVAPVPARPPVNTHISFFGLNTPSVAATATATTTAQTATRVSNRLRERQQTRGRGRGRGQARASNPQGVAGGSSTSSVATATTSNIITTRTPAPPAAAVTTIVMVGAPSSSTATGGAATSSSAIVTASSNTTSLAEISSIEISSDNDDEEDEEEYEESSNYWYRISSEEEEEEEEEV